MEKMDILHEEYLGYYLSLKTKHSIKYWCWAYKSSEIANYVRQCIINRWEKCPIQKYEDYTLSFVDKISQIVPTNINQSEIRHDWSNKSLNLKQISGYFNV